MNGSVVAALIAASFHSFPAAAVELHAMPFWLVLFLGRLHPLWPLPGRDTKL
jgi:hypothetical protein